MPEPTTPRVLCVDDHSVTRLLLEVSLAHRFDVTTAEDFDSALRLAQQEHFDLVVLDIQLEGTHASRDGVDLLHRLRRIPHMAEVPILALTAHGRLQHRNEYLQKGFDSYLPKPFLPEALAAQLLVLLQNATPRQSHA